MSNRSHANLVLNPPLSLRPEQPEDDEFLFRLFLASRADSLATMATNSPEIAQLLRMEFVSQQEQFRFNWDEASFDLVLVHGQPSGRLYISRDDTAFSLIDISLMPEYRSAGLGSSLLRALQDEANDADCLVRLHVLRVNPARNLYLRLGFETVAEDEVYAEMCWRSAQHSTP